MLWLQCYYLNKVSLNLVSMEFVGVAVSDKYSFLVIFRECFVAFAAENAAVRDGIIVEKFVSLCCNVGHSFFSSIPGNGDLLGLELVTYCEVGKYKAHFRWV